MTYRALVCVSSQKPLVLVLSVGLLHVAKLKCLLPLEERLQFFGITIVAVVALFEILDLEPLANVELQVLLGH